jgi:hypothetical protein
MSNLGYGVAGHINQYNSSARLGNWVEDRAGVDLAAHPTSTIGIYTTTQTANHIDPKDMTSHPSLNNVKLMSVDELKAKNKDGTSYSMLFDHGKPVPPTVRYRSSHRADFFSTQKFESKFARADKELAATKKKEAAITDRMALHPVPTSVQMSQFVAQPKGQYFVPAILAKGPSAPLPNNTYRHIITPEDH